MRIAIVYLGRRGSGGPLSFELATHLAARADVLAVLSTQSESLAAWRACGLPLVLTETYRTPLGAALSWLNHFALRRLARRICAWQPDVLIYPLFYTLNPFLQMHLAGIPSLVAVHDVEPHPGLRQRLYYGLENLSIRQATRCLVLSRAFVPAIVRRGVRPQRVDVIAHGELSYYRRFDRPAAAVLSATPTLLFFGRITAYKGLAVLLKAFRQVSARRPVRLLIVGEGDFRPYRPLAEGLPNVEIVNRWVSETEVDGFFRQANMVVLPYTSASQSGVIAIAAGYGLPVIATRTGGLPEQISEGTTGLLVTPGSASELAAAIERLLAAPQLARELGENLLHEYRRHRNWDRIAAEVYTACEQAVRDGRHQ